MSEWKAKRFWTEATVRTEPEGYGISLDGRPVKTPAKRVLTVPTEGFAAAIAADWAAQGEMIDPLSMPFTRSANAAVDKVSHQRAEVLPISFPFPPPSLTCLNNKLARSTMVLGRLILSAMLLISRNAFIRARSELLICQERNGQ